MPAAVGFSRPRLARFVESVACRRSWVFTTTHVIEVAVGIATDVRKHCICPRRLGQRGARLRVLSMRLVRLPVSTYSSDNGGQPLECTVVWIAVRSRPSMSNGQAGTTAFVLAGGGSFGAIQVGMLRELVDHGIKPDLVVGSSVGAINGAYFAGDPTAAGVTRLESIWCTLKRQDIFPVTLRRLAGLLFDSSALVDSRGLRRLIERHLPYKALEDAAIPVHVTATEVLSGNSVRLSSGPAVEAILASCAIPAAFPPVHVGEHYLFDGAVANNTPVVTAVELGASKLVVLPTGFACALKAPPTTALGNALHALTLLIARQLVRDLEQLSAQVDVVTVPPLCPIAVSPYDFSRARELIGMAAENTRRWLKSGGLTRQRIPGALRPHVD
jgi:NTE family protein